MLIATLRETYPILHCSCRVRSKSPWKPVRSGEGARGMAEYKLLTSGQKKLLNLRDSAEIGSDQRHLRPPF